MFEILKSNIPNIHKEGYIFIFLFMLAAFFMFTISNSLGWIGFFLTLWCIYFFRDPERITPTSEGLVVSPADGLIQKISLALPPAELNMKQEEMLRISVFLSVFDVHVNRFAVNGIVKRSHYHPGKFFNASLDKASEENERQSLCIELANGQEIALVQIAGLIARRIVCDAKEGENAEVGKRFGIIRFGSRVDIYLPVTASLMVAENQRAIGGETVIASLGDAPFKVTQWLKR